MAQNPKTGREIVKHPHSILPGADPLTDKDGRWWALATELERGAAAVATVLTLEQYQTSRFMLDALYVGLYENSPPYWLGNMAPRSPATPLASDVTGQRVTLNIIKSAVDTAAAMIAKNLAELRVLTSGGTWRQQQKAKRLTKYLAGAFDAMDYHRHLQRAFIDGCLTRKGAVKFWIDESRGRIDCERVQPHTLIWNDLEGDNPRSLYQKQPFPKEVLQATYPDQAEAIEKAPASVNPVNPAFRRPTGLSSHADMVDVIEGWHLPPDKDHPGRHVMALKGGEEGTVVLVDEEWNHEFFPFATFSWDDAYQGWGGRPAAETLIGYQIQIGRKMRTAQRAQDLACIPRVFRERGSEVIGDHVSNEIMGVVDYTGTPPTIAPAAALPPEFYTFLWRLKDEAFAEMGIPLLQSQGVKPAGLDSGEALRTFDDITATRQVVKGQRLERTSVDAGHIIIGLTKDLAKKRGKDGVKVLAQGNRQLDEIEWSEVDPGDDGYRLRYFAVSALPTHAVGRIQAVTDLIKSGMLPQEEGPKLLNFPDLEKVVTLATANQELAQMQVDEALYEGKYYGPEPFQDLALLKGLAQKEYVFACTLKEVPAKNMEFLQRLMSEADEMQKRAAVPTNSAPAPAAAPVAPPGTGGPPAAGAAPPPVPGPSPIPQLPTAQAAA